jgi:hypothetical protein
VKSAIPPRIVRSTCVRVHCCASCARARLAHPNRPAGERTCSHSRVSASPRLPRKSARACLGACASATSCGRRLDRHTTAPLAMDSGRSRSRSQQDVFYLLGRGLRVGCGAGAALRARRWREHRLRAAHRALVGVGGGAHKVGQPHHGRVDHHLVRRALDLPLHTTPTNGPRHRHPTRVSGQGVRATMAAVNVRGATQRGLESLTLTFASGGHRTRNALFIFERLLRVPGSGN